MILNSETRGDVNVVHVVGELVNRPEELLDALAPLLVGPNTKIVLDLAGVSFLNSAGVSELVRVTAQANVQESRVVLAQPTAFIAGVLQTTQLDRFFETYDTLDEAMLRIRQPRRRTT